MKGKITHGSLTLIWQSSLKVLPGQLTQDLKICLSGLESFLRRSKLGPRLGVKKHPQLELGLEICGDSKMKRINEEYRNKNKTTDVLSFPQFEDYTDLPPLPLLGLGDIFISLPVAEKQAKEHDIPLNHEVIHLLVHGFLHLLGLDHELGPEDARQMTKREDMILKKVLR